MANNVSISFISTITAFNEFKFTVTNALLGYTKIVTKQFVSGVPVTASQVQLGASNSATLVNLFNNLILNDVDASASFTMPNASNISMVFTVLQNYLITTQINTGGAFLFERDFIDDVIPEEIIPFEINYLSISIIDTYLNSDVVVNLEFTQESSPKLKYDSGDDLLGTIMASQLTFNMAVKDHADAFFKHLFTGDENQFLVQLKAYDIDDNEQLLWQGYLLPDQYKEPWKNGVFFVEFTAIDMLASLKGKYFPRWYYENTLPVVEVIALCLQATGLNQNILINPSFLPSLQTDFNILNLDLKNYNKDEKFEDYYKILEEILTSNCMTIYSYKEFWIITGYGEKRNENPVYFQYDVNGIKTTDYQFNKVIRQNFYSSDSVNFSLKTPFKTVVVNSHADGDKNMYSETVVNALKDNYRSGFNPYLNYSAGTITLPYADPGPDGHYNTNDFLTWTNSNSKPYFFFRQYNELFFRYRYFQPVYGWDNYNVTESTALANYYSCTEKPFLKSNVLYTIELEIDVVVFTPASDFQEKLKKGLYDKIACFQLLVNGQEVLSNRPSFPSASALRYESSSRPYGFTNDDAVFANFKLKYDFELAISGVAEFRLLIPISSGNTIRFYTLEIKSLKIGVTDSYDATENVTAVRAINFNEKLNYDMQLSSTSDTSIKNNYGLIRPLLPNYFYTILRNNLPSVFQDIQVFPPALVLQYKLMTFQITDYVRKTLFGKGFKKALFLESIDGSKKSFLSVYYKITNSVSRLGYVFYYTGRPKKPKTYKMELDIVPTDILKYMQVIYPLENLENRNNWKLKNSVFVGTFNKIVARLLHSIYNKPCYVLEGTVMNNVFPDEILNFYFDDKNRKFIPTRLELNLFEGKTQITATEDIYEEVTDIIYE